MKKRNKEDSPAYQLAKLVWVNNCKATDHAWNRVNHSMREAVRLAINAGLIFAPEDFGRFRGEFRSEYWDGETGGEGFYTLAVATGNLSAAQSFETWKGRAPFIADDVRPASYGYATRAGNRQRERLAVDFSFAWKGEQPFVTSFVRGGAYLTACTYKDNNRYDGKVVRRFKITVADIQAERARGKLFVRANKLLTDGVDADDIWKALGMKKKEDWYTVPLEKITKVVADAEKKGSLS